MLISPKNILSFFASPLLRVMLFAFKLNCRNADRLTSDIAAAKANFVLAAAAAKTIAANLGRCKNSNQIQREFCSNVRIATQELFSASKPMHVISNLFKL